MAKKVEKNSKRGRPVTTGTTPMRSIRVPEDEWQAWATAAEADGQALGAWIRAACGKALAAHARRKRG